LKGGRLKVDDGAPQRLGDSATQRLVEVRCLKCRKLLARADYRCVEIICPRCGFVNKFGPRPEEKK